MEHLFQELPKSQIKKLYKAGHLRTMHQGEIIFRKGESGVEFFVILTGRVAVVDQVGTKRTTLAELEVGDCFGEMAVFTGRKRSATVLCTEPGQLLVIDEDRLLKMAQKDLHPEFLEKVLVVLADRLRHVNRQYLQAKYGPGLRGTHPDAQRTPPQNPSVTA